jgi:aryl-alcohol dehydrogenase-like predicted oxidoreductase
MALSLPGIPLMPSRIVMGSVFFGTEITPEKTFAVLDAFVEAGGSFIDTAHVYAAWIETGVGASERTIGDWLHSRGHRDQVIVATKGAHYSFKDPTKTGRCSRADIEKDLTESLQRLRLDHVDLYWMHFDEPARPVGEIINTLASIKSSGRILAYGASNWSTDRIQAANEYAREHDLAPFIASQPWFSLGAVANGAKAEQPTDPASDPLIRWHTGSGLPMIPYSSQSNGYFGAENVAWAKGGFEGDPKRAAGFDSPANRQRLLRAIDLAGKKGCTPNQIALAYLLNQPFAIYPIIGTGNPDHAREALAAVDITLTKEEIASLFL